MSPSPFPWARPWDPVLASASRLGVQGLVSAALSESIREDGRGETAWMGVPPVPAPRACAPCCLLWGGVPLRLA